MTTLERVRAEIAEFKDEIAELPNMADAYAVVKHCLVIIDKYAEQDPCENNRLYIKVYADLEPQEKAEKLYQICEEDELKEVYKELGEYCDIEPCDDVVSRENAIIQISWDFPTLELPKIKESLDKLPSVRPKEPKTGHWTRQDNTKEPLYGWYFCSECNSVIGDKTKFCSNCGAKMEDKE